MCIVNLIKNILINCRKYNHYAFGCQQVYSYLKQHLVLSDKLIDKRFVCGQNVLLNTFFQLIKCKTIVRQ